MATRPVRHWAGKAPEGYKATSSDSDSDVEESPAVAVRAQEAKRVVESQDVQHGAKHYDRRLARISQAEDTGPLRNNRKTETTPSTRNSHRPSEEEETDVQRRNRIRALALRRQQEEEEEQQHIKAQEDEEDGSTEEEESEEEEEESEEDEEDTRVMLKPVFVSKWDFLSCIECQNEYSSI